MSWTTPIDWGAIPTPDQFNEQIRDNLLYLKGIVNDSLRVRKFTIYHDRVEPDLRAEYDRLGYGSYPIVWRPSARTIITDIAAHVTVPWDVGPIWNSPYSTKITIYREGSSHSPFATIYGPTSAGWILTAKSDKGGGLYWNHKRRFHGIHEDEHMLHRDICVSLTTIPYAKPTQGEMEVYLFYVEVE